MKHFLGLVVGLLVMGACQAEVQKLSPELRRRDATLNAGSKVEVIIQFRNKQSTLAGSGGLAGQRRIENFNRQKIEGVGGMVKHEFPTLTAVHASIPTSALEKLAADPEVAYISPDRPLRTLLNNATAAVNAGYAWGLGNYGTGIGVAVIDSGVHMVNDFKVNAGSPNQGQGGSRIVANFDLVGTGTDDQYGHGTHVAGIVAGNARTSLCNKCDVALAGIAPDANIINFRVLDQNGMGTDSAVINAIDQAIQLKATYNIRVINLSLGRGIFESYTQDPLCQAVEAAWNAGIVVVVAAGNDGRNNAIGNNGYGTINAPANDPYVITVGAMNTLGTPDRSDDIMTSYSSKGPTVLDHVVKPDLVAQEI